MSDDTRRLASEHLPRVSPELALVDAAMADGLRRRAQVLARRRPMPLQVLRVVPEREAAPPLPTDDGDPDAA